jgi:hypothetical protein
VILFYTTKPYVQDKATQHSMSCFRRVPGTGEHIRSPILRGTTEATPRPTDPSEEGETRRSVAPTPCTRRGTCLRPPAGTLRSA